MPLPFARWFQRKSTTTDNESSAPAVSEAGTGDAVPMMEDMYALDNAIHSDVQAPDTVIGKFEDDGVEHGLVSLPLLGRAMPAKHLKTLFALLGLGLVVLIVPVDHASVRALLAAIGGHGSGLDAVAATGKVRLPGYHWIGLGFRRSQGQRRRADQQRQRAGPG